MANDPIRDYLSQLGRKGAQATNAKLTPAQRKKSAKRAAAARWAKQKKEKSA